MYNSSTVPGSHTLPSPTCELYTRHTTQLGARRTTAAKAPTRPAYRNTFVQHSPPNPEPFPPATVPCAEAPPLPPPAYPFEPGPGTFACSSSKSCQPSFPQSALRRSNRVGDGGGAARSEREVDRDLELDLERERDVEDDEARASPLLLRLLPLLEEGGELARWRELPLLLWP